VKVPVGRQSLNLRIKGISIFQHTANQGLSKTSHSKVIHCRWGDFFLYTPIAPPFNHVNYRWPLMQPEMLQGTIQIPLRIMIVLKQKLNRALARLTTGAHGLRMLKKSIEQKEIVFQT
jgi:hypothetical protein